MVSMGVMVQKLSALLGTKDLSEWEQGFVANLEERFKEKTLTGITDRQAEVLERLYFKHFA